MRDMFGALMFLIGFSLVVIMTATGVKSFIDHRRWLRVSKIQTDAHSKLLDRLTSNEDLLAYIQSPAGRQFLEAAPLTVATAVESFTSSPYVATPAGTRAPGAARSAMMARCG